jgi:hypothetical protein
MDDTSIAYRGVFFAMTESGKVLKPSRIGRHSCSEAKYRAQTKIPVIAYMPHKKSQRAPTTPV